MPFWVIGIEIALVFGIPMAWALWEARKMERELETDGHEDPRD
ncbi:MAG: hypothetical protein AAFQ84_13295 [Pseudomonadota bacterium]